MAIKLVSSIFFKLYPGYAKFKMGLVTWTHCDVIGQMYSYTVSSSLIHQDMEEQKDSH